MFLAKIFRKNSCIEKAKASLFDLLSKNPKIKYSELSTQSSFKEIGLNSLDIIELIVDLEEDLKIDLLPDEVVNINTCDEAIKTFSKHLNSKFN